MNINKLFKEFYSKKQKLTFDEYKLIYNFFTKEIFMNIMDNKFMRSYFYFLDLYKLVHLYSEWNNIILNKTDIEINENDLISRVKQIIIPKIKKDNIITSAEYFDLIMYNMIYFNACISSNQWEQADDYLNKIKLILVSIDKDYLLKRKTIIDNLYKE